MFRIDHVNINVKDMEKSIAFFAQAFGLKEVRRRTAESGSYIIAFLTDDAGKFFLELTWLKEKDRPYNLGDNESHIGFVTDDMDAAYKLHKEMDIVCYENKARGVYFIADPDGYWHEIKPAK